MTLSLVMKLVHVFAAFWFTIGIVGRNVILSKARNCADIREVNTLLSTSGIFEKNMVIPGAMAVLLVGIFTAWSEGWPILGFLQGGSRNWVLVSLILFLTTIPLVNFVFLPRGKLFDAALKGATAQGRVTPELTAAFHDPVVGAAHAYEIVIIILIIILMVTKPF